MGYEAFVVEESSRKMLAEVFPPKYADWIGHHVTYAFGVPPIGSPFDAFVYNQLILPVTNGTMFGESGVHVIGRTEDDGLEVLICTVDGGSQRPDGGTYHITWSLDREKKWKPVDSNRVIAEKGTMYPVDAIPVVTTFQYIK